MRAPDRAVGAATLVAHPADICGWPGEVVGCLRRLSCNLVASPLLHSVPCCHCVMVWVSETGFRMVLGSSGCAHDHSHKGLHVFVHGAFSSVAAIATAVLAALPLLAPDCSLFSLIIFRRACVLSLFRHAGHTSRDPRPLHAHGPCQGPGPTRPGHTLHE